MRASLLQTGLDLEERDFFQDRFSERELRSLLGGRSPSELFSWKSPSFRKLGASREDLDDDELVRLMIEEPRLIRRPLIQRGDEVLIGTDTDAMERAFPP